MMQEEEQVVSLAQALLMFGMKPGAKSVKEFILEVQELPRKDREDLTDLLEEEMGYIRIDPALSGLGEFKCIDP